MIASIFRSRSQQSFHSNSTTSSSSTISASIPSNQSTEMCGCCCGASQFCPPLLGSILGCHRRTRQSAKWWPPGGKRAAGVADGGQVAALLTPYELEQLPLMLRELDRANRHFWQMVCWRMENRMRKESSKEEEAGMAKEKAKEKRKSSSKDQAPHLEGNGGEMEAAQRRGKGIDDSYADGCALRELVRMMAKTLCEKGAFDEDADQMLADYRQRLLGEDWHPSQQQIGAGGQMRGSPGPTKGLAERRREFAQKGRAISFNGALDKALATQQEKQTNGGKMCSSSSNSSSGSSSTSSGYSSEANAGQTVAGNAGRRAASWLRQRANSVRSRSTRRCACQAQQKIGQLGELLNAEFHSTVYAHPEQFDVHERELKVLVWRRFVHLLMALLVEKGLYGEKEKKAERR